MEIFGPHLLISDGILGFFSERVIIKISEMNVGGIDFFFEFFFKKL